MKALRAYVALIAIPLFTQGQNPENWVATWATSQQLAPQSPGPLMPRRAPGAPPLQPPARPPQSGRANRPAPVSVPEKFVDQTVRMSVRASAGGKRVRIELSHMVSAQPVEIGSAHIALGKGSGSTVEGSDRKLTFSGNEGVILQPGMLAVSDPVELEIPPLSELVVSLYLPKDSGTPTSHRLGLHTTYITPGDQTSAATVSDQATKIFSYVWLSSVDVLSSPDAFTVVALGDSITDGQATTVDADRSWPALLAKRLNASPATRNVAVVNQGISGNQVLRDGMGVSALARLDRDVLSRPGVRWVVLLEGINDINLQGSQPGEGALTPEDLIWGYKQIVARCHLRGIRVVGATIMPEKGVWIANERTEEIRQTVNRWIRTKGNFDAVVDFDAIARDPSDQSLLRAEFNPGDHIHPNDAGNQAMADAFDLAVFKK